MAESYRTIRSEIKGFYKEKGSKFISLAYHVDSLDQVKSRLEALRKEYHDARHHCYAYVIRGGLQEQIRANDDGEPNHSAGDPILGQIRSFELTNVLIVVVRYFGGTKLGVSGLIQAYKTAAEEALSQANVEVVEIKEDFKVEYGYDKTSEVMRIVNDFGVEIKNQEYLEICTLYGRIDPERFGALKDKLSLAQVIARKL
ncbi:MAG: YigZ family protein [Reichenbachiella sp.]|uniref:IMPACT family protein n=1 Tax=Reichenbachiella sp. TaxID=2184521 RepID=UPI003263B921